MVVAPLRLVPALLLTCLLASACGDPPTKEMAQAQGAIDAARAAGAERYAPEEYQAAVTALDRAEQAVGQRDYRLALNFALDAREQAQAAARQAADQKARVRSEAERALALLTTALAQATARLESARGVRNAPKAPVAEAEAAVAAGQKALQEAGTALGREDYPEARDVLRGVAARVAAASTTLETALAAPPPRPARRPR